MMKILYLGPECKRILKHLKSFGDRVSRTEKKLTICEFIEPNYDFIISYGYRFIIPKRVTDYYKKRIINLHISYLPWNRGADPNFWSIIDNTPKGVTIHFVDEGLDTGDIIIQKKVELEESDTLRTSYEKLSNAIEKLFMNSWIKIKDCEIVPEIQMGEGTFHYSKDKELYRTLLINGWDTKISELEKKK
ncbi:formyltransferase family protein [Lysinibacillus xylanilyticus]|uniref:formyltransferase family protein n=1 Tax=Lysinibacillus xylanilyticus TaxID=582475 RepID=UPI003CFE21EC